MDAERGDHETEPAVRRAEGVARSMPSSHQAEIDRLIEERTEATSGLYLRIAEAESRTVAPLAELLKRDERAEAAARDLARLRLEAVERSRKTLESGAVFFSGPAGPYTRRSPGSTPLAR
ncbi:hypothetical protein NKH18_04040 [Streptomyces sp. M10(2022)]